MTAQPQQLLERLLRGEHLEEATASELLRIMASGEPAPYSPQERWENQSGYSPGTIAAEIAGLVCAAEIAQANEDDESAELYLETADSWQAEVEGLTVTATGPYSDEPYYLRLTKDGNPDLGTPYSEFHAVFFTRK